MDFGLEDPDDGESDERVDFAEKFQVLKQQHDEFSIHVAEHRSTNQKCNKSC